MTAFNVIFFMGGPQPGALEAGLVASLLASRELGVSVSIVSGGLATLLVAAAVAARARVGRETTGAGRSRSPPPHRSGTRPGGGWRR